jgi:hypothetical protein
MSKFTFTNIFQVHPDDVDWNACSTVEDHGVTLEADLLLGMPGGARRSEIQRNLEVAWDSLRNEEWEPMVLGDPRVLPLSDDDSSRYAFVWRQDRDDTLTVVGRSNVKLEELQERWAARPRPKTIVFGTPRTSDGNP